MRITKKELAKITHDINNVWHSRYEGKTDCYIITRTNESDSPYYTYRFHNYGFNNYRIYHKKLHRK